MKCHDGRVSSLNETLIDGRSGPWNLLLPPIEDDAYLQANLVLLIDPEDEERAIVMGSRKVFTTVVQ